MVLNDKKGRRYIRGEPSLGFAGSVLMDLFFLGKIVFTKSTFEIINSRSTGSEILDQILEILVTSKIKRDLRIWIANLSLRYKHYYHLYFELMAQQGIIRKEFSRFLLFQLYYLQKPEIKSQLLEKIHSIVGNNKEPSINIICLLTLLDVSGILLKYVSRGLRKKIRNRLKEILNSEQLDSSSREMILSIKEEIWSLAGPPNFF